MFTAAPPMAAIGKAVTFSYTSTRAWAGDSMTRLGTSRHLHQLADAPKKQTAARRFLKLVGMSSSLELQEIEPHENFLTMANRRGARDYSVHSIRDKMRGIAGIENDLLIKLRRE